MSGRKLISSEDQVVFLLLEQEVYLSTFVYFLPFIFFILGLLVRSSELTQYLITVNSSFLVYCSNFYLVPTNFSGDPWEETVVCGKTIWLRLGVSQDPKSGSCSQEALILLVKSLGSWNLPLCDLWCPFLIYLKLYVRLYIYFYYEKLEITFWSKFIVINDHEL